jgi:hypothetical protein
MRAALAAACLLFAFACTGGGGGEQCSAFGAACADGGTVEQCCSKDACRYQTSDGTNFPCAGLICQDAAAMVRDWCKTH